MNENTKSTTKKKTASTEEQIAEKPVPKTVDIHEFIVVRNGFNGKLVYVSRRTGEEYVWDNFGDEQEIELLELKNAKGSSKKFFVNNWFMFDDDWVIDYLGVRQFYKNALKLDEFDELFKLSPAQIEKRVAVLSNGQKRSVAYRAKQLIADGEIDSNKAIAALEKSLGMELIER